MATYKFYVEIETEEEVTESDLYWTIQDAINFSDEVLEAFGEGFDVWVSQE